MASGMVLVLPERHNPLITTARRIGELMLQALENGVRNIIIGIGMIQVQERQAVCGVNDLYRHGITHRNRNCHDGVELGGAYSRL